MKKYILLGISYIVVLTTYAQTIQMTEISNSNTSILSDEDGDYNDWIELFNHSNIDTISLKGYFLSDDKKALKKWAFPDIKILPRSFMVVQASKKDKHDLPHHWETAVHGDSLWTYSTPYNQSNEEYLQWIQVDFPATGWLSGRGAIGYGYNAIETETPEDRHSIFMRQDFYLQDTSKIMALVLHHYYDDGIVAYINGYEVMRENVVHDGRQLVWNGSSFFAHPSVIDEPNTPPRAFVIEPDLWKALLKNGKNTLAVQVHNHWEHMPIVAKSWLSFAVQNDVYQTDSLEPNLPINHLPLHTNFSIAKGGEDIYLYYEATQDTQKIVVPQLPANTSCGWHWDIPNNQTVYFKTPSPGKHNNTPALYIVEDSLQLSSPSGIYATAVEVNIGPLNEDYTIRYTTDGSIPSDTSNMFTQSFDLDTSSVVRCAYFRDSALHGPISTAAYIIGETNHTDVFSLMITPDDFYSKEKGINAFGTDYLGDFPYFEANFWQKWERPVLIQYFNTQNQLLWEQHAGIKIHGNYSRAYNQKSFGLYAKKKYGETYFPPSLFPDKAYIKSSKRFVLRNAGNDKRLAHVRDMLIHTRMKNTNADIQTAKTVAAYVNTKYWGVYHLREKVDRYYLQNNFGVDPDKVNLLERNGLIISGERKGFESIMQYVRTHNFENDDTYSWISSRLDIANWIDYYITHIYHHNTDWPHHNTKFWNAPGHKWRQIVVDVDVSMNVRASLNAAYLNSLNKIHTDSISYSAIIYKALLQNYKFKRQYVNRFADLINTILLPQNYRPLLDSIVQIMDADMHKQSDRWGTPYYNNWSGVYLDNIKTFIQDKPDYMRKHLRQRYALGNYDTIHLSVNNTEGGYIKLNTINMSTNDWEGVYFDSIPVYLEAIPYPGYQFVGWESATSPQLADSTRIVSTHQLQSQDYIKALFFSPTGGADTLDIAFSEIAYKKFENADADDWIELLNRENTTVDISGWTLRCDLPYKQWEIPQNTQIEAGGRLLLVHDKDKFKTIYPLVDTNYIVGNMTFGLNKLGEHIWLYDELDRLVSHIHFTNTVPWPLINGEKAETIELVDDTADYHLPHNWQLSSCPGGTPVEAYNNDCQDTQPLLFTEINYKSANEYDTKDWVELFNNGEKEVDLSHCIFSDKDKLKHRYYFPENTVLAPDAMLIIAEDTTKFFSLYPHVDKQKVFGPLDFGLSAKGENISIHNRFGHCWMNMDYVTDAPWPQNASGTGYTIELKDTTLNMQEGTNWESQCFMGTPIQLPSFCVHKDDVFISEVFYQTATQQHNSNWIELYNQHNYPIDLSGWSIFQYHHDSIRFRDHFIIPAHDYAIIAADSSTFMQTYPNIDSALVCFSPTPFELDADEEQLLIVNQWQKPGALLSYDINQGWPLVATDTNNQSLELLHYDQPTTASSWRIGCEMGSPLQSPDSCNIGITEWGSPNYKVYIFPNPTQDKLYMQVDSQETETVYWQLYNMQSQAVTPPLQWHLQQGKQQTEIDIKHLSSGVYSVIIYTNQWQVVRKIVVK